jgi:gamma-glutamyl-gamma-aminobutyrate hydrolase PuuD
MIGLTTDTRDVDLRVEVIRSATVGRDYVDAIWDAGGLPILLPTVDVSGAVPMLEACTGLLLIGGGDIEPATYGEPAHPTTSGIDTSRDAFELMLTKAALERNIPILGVCRGAQLLNVACGGSLRQDLNSDLCNHWSGFEPAHPVVLDPDSLISVVYGSAELNVNSLHHQAVARLGAGLRATAWSPDLAIEAIEHESRWAVGVQWHPESPPVALPGIDALLRAFVHQASLVAGNSVFRSERTSAA